MVERAPPEAGRSEVRVRVHASALNRADVLQRRGGYPAPAGSPPDIPGLEYAGEVESVGSGVLEWKVGDRVMGIVGGGGHAELLCVHEREAMLIPREMPYAEAAAIPEAFLTAYDALFRQLNVRLGERVLIHAAASGVGTAAVQLAHVAGARTFGTSRTPAKLERLLDLGLDHAVDSSGTDWPAAVLGQTGGEGVDAIVDLVGGSYHAANMKVLADGGRLILVGTLGGAKADLDLRLLLTKRLRLIGTILRSRPLEEKIALARDFSATILPLFAADRIRPVVDRVYPFAEIAEAHRRMERNEGVGKIVLQW